MAKKTTKRADPHILAQDTALELAASLGWRDLSLAQVAETSGLGLGDLLQIYPSKSSIIRGFMDRIDAAMLQSLSPDDAGEIARDRLFDLIMSRFDALLPYRQGLIAIAKAEARDPLGGLCHLIRFRRSLVLMLEAAGLSASGLMGQLRLKGIALVYANAIRVWINDDSTDMATTMAALDQGLARAEKLARYSCCGNVADDMADLTD